jgi:L-alanine-DL-glutamate epimerase-like enolase superfamily enzyme
VVWVEIDHDGVVGHGEAAPVTYLGQTQEGMLEFIEAHAPALLGEDPFAVAAIVARLRAAGGPSAAVCAVEAALHDWIGKRLGLPLWRLLGLAADAPATSYTVGVDTVEGTIDRVRRHPEFEVIKLKLGGADDVARLEAVRRATDATIRVDVNEGWTLERTRELMPALVAARVEFLEQPLPAADAEGYHALRELEPRVPIVADEGCQDLATVAPLAAQADGISIKLEKAGGLREALRVIAAARALGLGVMLSCMLESQLGLAHAAQVASLVDWADLDGHFLVGDLPYTGLRFEAGRVLPSEGPGLGVTRVDGEG